MNPDEKIIALLEELVAWSRLSARKELLPFLETVLADPRHRLAFELSDGTRTQTQVAEQSGLSQATISGLRSKWRRQGILRDTGGKPIHIVRPSDYGLNVVDLKGESNLQQRRTRATLTVSAEQSANEESDTVNQVDSGDQQQRVHESWRAHARPSARGINHEAPTECCFKHVL